MAKGLILLVLYCVCCCRSAWAQLSGGALSIDMSLVRSTLFVGEVPDLVLKIRAPADRDVTIMRPDYRVFRFLALDTVLHDPNGKADRYTAPEARHHGADPEKDLVTIPRGKVLEVRVALMHLAEMPGTYRLEIVASLEGPNMPATKRVLEFEAVALEERNVVSRIQLTEAGKPRHVELLIMKSGTGHILLHKNERRVHRIDEVEADSRIHAIVEEISRSQLAGIVLIMLEGRDRMRLLRIDYFTGRNLGSG